MSIVERALEKARAEKKFSEAAQPMYSGEAAPLPGVFGQGAILTTAYGAEAFARATATPFQIDLNRLRELGRLPPEVASRQAKEEMRRIKWPLLSAMKADRVSAPVRNNIIQVTSAVPGEGKTYTALMLALSIAQDREMRVVLVDGDVARPGLTSALELEGKRGFLDVIEDRNLDISMVTYQTDVEGLFVIPAGNWHEQASELLASSRMPQIIGDLMHRLGNGVVVLDSPPVLATNEAQVLSRYVGQVLFVVRADETDQHAIRDALALIDKAAQTSAILNSVQRSALGRYYGAYGYGYGYGDRSRSSERAESKAGVGT